MVPYLRHFHVTKFVPEILNRVQPDQCSHEEADPFDAANASNGDTQQHQPETPLRREWVMLKTVESRPAKDRCEREAEKHGVEKNEPADSGVRVLEEDHDSDQPDCGALEV